MCNFIFWIFSFIQVRLKIKYSIFSKVGKRSTRFLGFFNSFCGGIFAGIGLFLFLRDSKVTLSEYADINITNEKWREMPYAEFIVFISYSFMLFIEKVCFSTQSLIPMLNEGGNHGHHHEHDEERSHSSHGLIQGKEEEVESDSDEDEEAFKNVVGAKGKFASFLQIRNSKFLNNLFSENV